MFGKDRIQRNMVANAMYPAQRMAQFEYDDLMRFMSHEMEDDVSVLVLKYLNTSESELEEAKQIKADFQASMEQMEKEAAEVEEVEDLTDSGDADEIGKDDALLSGMADDILDTIPDIE